MFIYHIQLEVNVSFSYVKQESEWQDLTAYLSKTFQSSKEDVPYSMSEYTEYPISWVK